MAPFGVSSQRLDKVLERVRTVFFTNVLRALWGRQGFAYKLGLALCVVGLCVTPPAMASATQSCGTLTIDGTEYTLYDDGSIASNPAGVTWNNSSQTLTFAAVSPSRKSVKIQLSSGNITITGTLTVNNDSGPGLEVIGSSCALTLSNITLNATGTTEGIKAADDISIEDESIITAIGAGENGSGIVTSGSGKTIKITSGTKVTAKARGSGYSLSAGSFVVANGTTSAYADDGHYVSNGSVPEGMDVYDNAGGTGIRGGSGGGCDAGFGALALLAAGAFLMRKR
jgi:Synergist-CTERM protein sorting domain-containing protein